MSKHHICLNNGSCIFHVDSPAYNCQIKFTYSLHELNQLLSRKTSCFDPPFLSPIHLYLVLEVRCAIRIFLGWYHDTLCQRFLLGRLPPYVDPPHYPPHQPGKGQTPQRPRVAENKARGSLGPVDLARDNSADVGQTKENAKASGTFPIRGAITREPGAVVSRC